MIHTEVEVSTLTWEDNYKKYYKETGINIVDNYEMVADNLEIAANTGCWYWDKME